MTKIDLITGVLGAGKTTFLLRYGRYLLDKGERIAIVVNDFGAVNADMLFLQELKCERCQIEMICGCGDPDAHRRRYKTQLIALGMQHFDRILIEPSGIFDMDEFFDTIYEAPLDRWFEIGSILSIVDAQTEEPFSEEMEFLLGSEAASAGMLILSKLEWVMDEPCNVLTERMLERVNRALAYIRCDRRISARDLFSKPWDDLTAEDFALFERAGYHGASYVKLFHTQSMRSQVHYFMHLRIQESAISAVLRTVMEDAACGHVYRIKGSLPADDGGWRKINVTRERMEIASAADGQAVLLVIGAELNLACIDAHLRRVNLDPDYTAV